ncbi:aldo/keto reductase [Alkalicoccobacillus murimartini]|uniref:Diketogulonate reductase-like aldo/keto reductase n=1 Tax=Alkalicoccobacillus murimartini TaxID=171685 RepID=A0ABT9YLU0_9BACI|nr:aldo/keto reductase [Alkalicoccobacillus murimartini]MDQ0208706.1 diketogulonate reductase-like aldo/keto reductase [Alkalicoccobacillus murimartini]
MENVTLTNGVKMPLNGFGVYQITDQKEAEESVIEAIKAGYRLIDTAAAYKNEKAVGNAIQKSGVAREELFITSKLWVSDTGYETTKAAFAKTLELLQVDYLDLYLLHQPYGDIYGSWRALEELYKEGKTRSIGVSNFYTDRLVDFILHNEVTPHVNQIEVNPFLQQEEAMTIHKEYDVVVQAWAPFAEGRNGLFTNEKLEEIGKKHNKSVAQVVLRWLTQRCVSALAKSVNPNRIAENFDIWNFELDKQDMKIISALDTNTSSFFSHRDPAMVKALGSNKLER